MRKSLIERNTAETRIKLRLELDGSGQATVDSGCGFLDHMLTLFSRHSGFDLEVSCQGDTKVDYHHSVEDIGICLGQALREALGDMAGLARYGSCLLPMDEALILTAVDISGRAYVACELAIPAAQVGDFDTELAEEFLRALSREARLTLHAQQLAGSNSHHIIEGLFKSLARSLRAAVALTGDDRIPSTKGII